MSSFSAELTTAAPP